jgi:ribosomal protein S18 acetylase RimI-like enzyme
MKLQGTSMQASPAINKHATDRYERDGAGIRIERANALKPDDALCLIEEYYEAVDVMVRDNRDALLRYLSDRESGVWIAYSGSIPVGCVLYRALPHLGSAGEVKRLYVRPAYRGRGVASLLLRTLEKFAMDRKISRLYLDSKDDLRDAIAFYTRHGYTRCDRYNDNPQATIFMRKELSSIAVLS